MSRVGYQGERRLGSTGEAYSDDGLLYTFFGNIQYQQQLTTEQLLPGQAVYGPFITVHITPAGPLSSSLAGQNAVLGQPSMAFSLFVGYCKG
jgi:hypothetical protein